MAEILSFDPSFWHWWALGVVLIGIEIIVPSTFLLGPALAGFVMGVLQLIFPDLGFDIMLGLYAVMALILTVFIRRYVEKYPLNTDRPLLNQRSAKMVGQRTTLTETLLNGKGRIPLGDSTWTARSEDGSEIQSGSKVEVVDADGATLIVRAVD